MADNILTITGEEALNLSGFDSGDTVVLQVQGKVRSWSEPEEGKHSISIKVQSVDVEDTKNFKDAVRRSVKELRVTPRIEPSIG